MLLALFILVAFSSWQMVLCARIQITPVQFDGLTPIAFNVSCRPDNDETCNKGNVLIIQILRGAQRMASIRQRSSIGYDDDVASIIEADGHIDSDVPNNFLRLTIRHIINVDPSNYTCLLYCIDEKGFMVEEKDYEEIVTDDVYLQQHVKFLLQKLFLQENLIQHQAQKLKEHEQHYRSLEIQLSNYEGSANRKMFSDLKDITMKQTRDIAELTKKGSRAEKKMDDLENFSKNKLMELLALIEEDRFVSAFSAGYNRNDAFSGGEVVLFDNAVMSEGPGYDNTTGLYTAPRKGIYVFHLGVMNTFLHNWIDLSIQVNGKTLASTSNADDTFWDHTSTSCIAKLERGDVVRVVVAGVKTKQIKIRKSPYSFFSGHLVNTL